MKNLLIALLALLGISCSSAPATSAARTSTKNNAQSAHAANDTLIIYFSRSGENYDVGNVKVGNTAMMAGYIAEVTGGTLFEIVPSTPYPDNYDQTLARAQKEFDDNLRPAFKNKLEGLDQYSVVFIGGPIWYHITPRIMETFYEAYPELGTKTIIPFGTHEGSGIGGCTTILRQHFAQATILEGLGLWGTATRNKVEQSKLAVKNWVEKLKK